MIWSEKPGLRLWWTHLLLEFEPWSHIWLNIGCYGLVLIGSRISILQCFQNLLSEADLDLFYISIYRWVISAARYRPCMLDNVFIDVPLLCAKPPLLPRIGANASVCHESVGPGVVGGGARDLHGSRRPNLLAHRNWPHLAPVLLRLKVVILTWSWSLFYDQRL